MPTKILIDELMNDLEKYLEENITSPKEGAAREFFDELYEEELK